jgi:chromosome segregation ATPase
MTSLKDSYRTSRAVLFTSVSRARKSLKEQAATLAELRSQATKDLERGVVDMRAMASALEKMSRIASAADGKGQEDARAIAGLQVKVTDLETQLAESRQRESDARGILATLQAKLNAAGEEEAALREKLGSTETKLAEEISGARDRARATEEEHARERAKLSANAEDLRRELARLHDEVKSKELEARDKDEVGRRSQGQAARLQADVEAAHARARSLEARIAEKQKEIEELSKSHRRQIEDLQEGFQRRAQEAAEKGAAPLLERVRSAEAEVKSLREEVDALRRASKDREALLTQRDEDGARREAALAREIASLKQDLDRAAKEARDRDLAREREGKDKEKDRDRELEGLRAREREAVKRLEEARSEVDEYRELMRVRDDKIAALGTKVSSLESDLRAKGASADADNDRALEAMETHLLRLSEVIRAREAEIAGLKQTINIECNERIALLDEISHLKRELSGARGSGGGAAAMAMAMGAPAPSSSASSSSSSSIFPPSSSSSSTASSALPPFSPHDRSALSSGSSSSRNSNLNQQGQRSQLKENSSNVKLPAVAGPGSVKAKNWAKR